MGVVIHRVDLPFVPSLRVRGVDLESVYDGVAHVNIARAHVDFEPERRLAYIKPVSSALLPAPIVRSWLLTIPLS